MWNNFDMFIRFDRIHERDGRTVGVPQGSVVGPLLFSTYTSPISTIAQSHLVTISWQQQNADDTQLYISFSPSELSGQINALQSCLASLDSWFCEIGLALNPTRSDAIMFGTHQRLKSLTNLESFNVAGAEISLADHVKILGTASLDSSLTMDKHTKAVSKSRFYHICSFRQTLNSLDDNTALSVATALVTSRLDYSNSILFGCPLKYRSRLRRVQNALARVTVPQNSSFPTRSTTALLRHLHWLPVDSRTSFKLSTITFKALGSVIWKLSWDIHISCSKFIWRLQN